MVLTCAEVLMVPHGCSSRMGDLARIVLLSMVFALSNTYMSGQLAASYKNGLCQAAPCNAGERLQLERVGRDEADPEE